jgi:hypothetical protein
LEKSIQKLVKEKNNRRIDDVKIGIKINGALTLIPISRILFIEKDGRKS